MNRFLLSTVAKFILQVVFFLFCDGNHFQHVQSILKLCGFLTRNHGSRVECLNSGVLLLIKK